MRIVRQFFSFRQHLGSLLLKVSVFKYFHSLKICFHLGVFDSTAKLVFQFLFNGLVFAHFSQSQFLHLLCHRHLRVWPDAGCFLSVGLFVLRESWGGPKVGCGRQETGGLGLIAHWDVLCWAAPHSDELPRGSHSLISPRKEHVLIRALLREPLRFKVFRSSMWNYFRFFVAAKSWNSQIFIWYDPFWQFYFLISFLNSCWLWFQLRLDSRKRLRIVGAGAFLIEGHSGGWLSFLLQILRSLRTLSTRWKHSWLLLQVFHNLQVSKLILQVSTIGEAFWAAGATRHPGYLLFGLHYEDGELAVLLLGRLELRLLEQVVKPNLGRWDSLAAPATVYSTTGRSGWPGRLRSFSA